jgi:hypothetical protein
MSSTQDAAGELALFLQFPGSTLSLLLKTIMTFLYSHESERSSEFTKPIEHIAVDLKHVMKVAQWLLRVQSPFINRRWI